MNVPGLACRVMPFVSIEATCVVNQHTDRTESFSGLRDQAVYLGFIGQVCSQDNRTLTKGVDLGMGFLGFFSTVVAMDGDTKTVPREFDGNSPAETLGA